MIGKTISHYTILEKLGEGGMGVVYKAQDTKLKRTVALKFLPPEFTRDPEAKKRFLHEAQAAATLDHSNICTIHEIEETEDGQVFIAMAHYKGESLQQKIQKGPLKLDAAFDIAIQIAQGLAKAHSKKIVHRDIKSANILITQDDVAKIVDFGLAKLAGRTKLTQEGSTLGTVAYMSPEQARGEKVDHRSDIWSLGVVLYEMITGRLPFKGDYDQSVIYAVINEEPEPVTGLRSGIPMELERIVNKCLCKNTEERYQHEDDFIADLNKLLREFDASGKVHVLKVKKQKPPKQKSKRIYLLTAILVFSFVLIVVLIIFRDHLFQASRPKKEMSEIPEWENSIAVLPFDNLSGDPEQEYFCDGMTDQIISNLVRLNRLKVIPRTSIMQYKDIDKTIREIGKELKVAYILESSVRIFGNRIRVIAKLIDTENDFHLWSEDYDREYKDLFDLQDDVSETIAANLLTTLSGEEKLALKSNVPDNMQAYDYYLKGRYYFYVKATEAINVGYSHIEEQLNISAELLKKAIKLDPNFSDSYAVLADVYNTFYNRAGSFSKSDEEKSHYWQLQDAYLDTALTLNPESAEAYFIQHIIHKTKAEEYLASGACQKYEQELDKQYHCLKRTLEFNHHHNYAYSSLGIFFRKRGLQNLAVHYHNKSIDLDPLNFRFYYDRGYSYCSMGDNDQAIVNFKKALEIEPNLIGILVVSIRVLTEMNQFDEAEKMLLRAESIRSEWVQTKSLRAMMNILKGEKEKTNEKDLIPFDQWILDVLFKKSDAVLLYLNKDLERQKKSQGSSYLWLKNNALFDFIRPDPQFQEIIAEHKKLYEKNLKEYSKDQPLNSTN